MAHLLSCVYLKRMYTHVQSSTQEASTCTCISGLHIHRFFSRSSEQCRGSTTVSARWLYTHLITSGAGHCPQVKILIVGQEDWSTHIPGILAIAAYFLAVTHKVSQRIGLVFLPATSGSESVGCAVQTVVAIFFNCCHTAGFPTAVRVSTCN